MKRIIFIAIISAVGLFAIIFLVTQKSTSTKKGGDSTNSSQNNTQSNMLLTSASFNPNEKIPAKFTCDGGNINPELHIQNVPPEAKSLALIMDDPDAVGGKTFTHWLIWNIDPKTEIIKQESVPPGSTEGLNDTGKIGYLGPCPPDKKPHRYFFKLYTLDMAGIMFEAAPTKEQLEKTIAGHIIEKTELIGIYLRTN